MGAPCLTIGVEWFLAGALNYRLGTLDIQVHDNWVLPASDYYGLTRHIWAGADFLARDEGRNVNEVSRTGLITEL